jgi:hypothetical protein
MELIFNSASIKRFIYLVLTALVTFTVYYYYFHHSQRYWLVWSGLMLSLITTGDTRRQRIVIILLTGVCALGLAFVAGCLAAYLPWLLVYLFIITVCAMFMGLCYPDYFYLFFIINLFTLLAAGFVPSLTENDDRIVCIAIGTLIAAALQIIFVFKFMRNELRSWLIIALHHLQMLSEEIFSCFLQPEYVNNIYLFERRLHDQKNRFIQALARLREMASEVKTEAHETEKNALTLMLMKLDCLYDILLDGAQLRHRVTDHTIFQVCNDELTAVSQEMEKIIADVIGVLTYKKQHLELANLDVKITRFEENYQNVMRITAREPLVLLLFIASLKAFRNEVAALYEEALQVRLFLK